MSLIPTVYSSTDPGAPALTGQPGSFAALLDAVLVAGYGVGAEAKAPLGWSRPYQQGSTLRAYRNSLVAGTGHWLRVDDSQALYASLTGFETMSDIGTGNGMFPTSAQLSNGSAWAKSRTADATARAWWIIGNEVCFYIFIDYVGDGISAAAGVNFAGNFSRLNPADGWNYAISERNAGSYAGGSSFESLRLLQLGTVIDANPIGTGNVSLTFARALDGTISPRGRCAAGGPITQAYAGWQGLGTSGFAYPDPYSGGLLYSRLPILQAPQQIRGFLPGVYCPMHHGGIADMQILPDVDGLPPGTRLLCKIARIGGATQYPRVLFDLTNPW